MIFKQAFNGISLLVLSMPEVAAEERQPLVEHIAKTESVIHITSNGFEYNGVRLPMGKFEGQYPLFDLIGKETADRDGHYIMWEDLGLTLGLLKADRQCALTMSLYLVPDILGAGQENVIYSAHIKPFPGQVFIEGVPLEVNTSLEKLQAGLPNKIVEVPLFGYALFGSESAPFEVYLDQQRRFRTTTNKRITIRLREGRKGCK